MPSTFQQLPAPTKKLVIRYVQQFDQTQVVVEQALAKVFQIFPTNSALADVLVKVVTLNDLYRTGILATYKVAEHICTLNVDSLLQQGAVEAVNQIARVKLGAKIRNNYSFATKYCAWHNPALYPIYDSFVEKILWGYCKQDQFASFQRQDLWRYDCFKSIIHAFCDHYGLTAFTMKDIDKFLWQAGKEFYPAAWAKEGPK